MLSKTAFTTLFVAATFGMAFTQSVAAKPASSEGITVSKTVHFSDLDISTEAGAQSLLSRIRRAANYVCGGNDRRLQLSRGPGYRACVRDATSKAVADVGNPTVTAMYEGSNVRLATK
jgi:UrcA family protein